MDFTLEELRLNLVKGTTNNNGKGMMVKKEQENVALAEKVK